VQRGSLYQALIAEQQGWIKAAAKFYSPKRAGRSTWKRNWPVIRGG